ncbi:MAG: hypothetical protein N2487_01365 [Verrucomicrobiae bacterium]|nr:hypothetical protein [Verrucomicrobiae bacterium]
MGNCVNCGNKCRIIRVIIPVLILGLAYQIQAGWRWSNPLPHGNNIAEMFFSSDVGMAIQVADKGRIYISYDFYSWTPVESGVTNALRSGTFFGSRIIVVGENGLILFSDDGYTFTKAYLSASTTNWFEGVAAGKLNINSSSTSVLVAVGDNGSIYSSSDGSNWVKRTHSYTNWLRGVCFGTRSGTPIVVAVGESGCVLTSQNLANWSKVSTTTSQHLNRVIFTNGNFYAVGEGGVALIGMNGGSTWVSESTGATNSLNTIAVMTNGTRIYAGNNEVRYHNGTSWANLLTGSPPSSPAAWNYTSSLTVNGHVLLGGSTGFLCIGTRTNNTFRWTVPYNSVRQWIWDISTDSGCYIGVGNNGVILSSGDGVNWIVELTPTSATNSVLLGIGGDTNMLIAVGSQGTVLYSTNDFIPEISTNYSGTNIVLTTNYASALGVIWNSVEKFNTNTFQGVCKFRDEYYIAGDNGLIFKTVNGTNWSRITTTTTNVLSGLAASSSTIVAVGARGTILFSTNGSSWSLISSGTTNWIYKVRYLNNNFIAVGNNGGLFTSTNGINWTQRTSGTTKWLTDATYLNGTYYAIGTQGAFLKSTNLVNWTSEELITGKSLYAVGHLDGQLIVVGVEGAILRNQLYPHSTPVYIVTYAQAKDYSSGIIQHLFLFYGKPDQQFSLDSSEKLGTDSWKASETLEITDSSGFLYYIETDYLTNQVSSEFFRTRTIW